jgi:hypothetical protein
MGTDKVVFAEERWGATGSHVTGSHVTGSHVTGSDVSHVTGSDTSHVPCRKYVLRMCIRKLHNIRLSVAFWPEVTKSRDRKRPCPEALLTGSRFCACPVFPRVFFSVVVTWLPDVAKGHLTPSGFPWVCACATGSCATPVVTEGHVIHWKCPWGVLYDVRVL